MKKKLVTKRLKLTKLQVKVLEDREAPAWRGEHYLDSGCGDIQDVPNSMPAAMKVSVAALDIPARTVAISDLGPENAAGGAYCGNGHYCGDGNYSAAGVYCGDGQYCGDGDYSAAGVYCGDGVYCGEGEYCGAGTYCGDGHYCGNGVYSANGEYCAEGTYCGNGDYCGNGTYCGAGTYSANGDYSGEGVYCGGGVYCGDGFYCGDGTYCGDGNYCADGMDGDYAIRSGDPYGGGSEIVGATQSPGGVYEFTPNSDFVTQAETKPSWWDDTNWGSYDATVDAENFDFYGTTTSEASAS